MKHYTVGKSSLQVLGIRLEQHEQGLSREGLTQLAQQPLQGREGERGRRWCVEVDGCLVPTRVDGGVEWREVKSAVVYPMRCPSQRYYVSALTTATAFAPQVHGLLRHAGVRQSDSLIGLSDGAAWIAELFGELECAKKPIVNHQELSVITESRRPASENPLAFR